MKPIRWLIPLVSFLLLVAIVPLNASVRPAYTELRIRIDRGNTPDSSTIQRLPPPETAEETWLKSRVTTRIDSSLKLLESSVRQSQSPAKRVTYLKEWLRISLLQSPADLSGQFLKDTLSNLRPGGYIDGETWYLAGQFADYIGDGARSAQYFSRIDPDSSFYDRGLLARASQQLDQDRPRGASRTLDRYFFSSHGEKRPFYWILRGRYFESTGADSEAYIAYSHVINYYPRSLTRRLAERSIGSLPLPEALYPGSGSSRSGSPTVERTSRPGNSGQREGGVSIQAGSFRERNGARRLRQSLREITDHSIKINTASVNGQRYYRVQITGIDSRTDAEQLLGQLKTSGYDGFIVTP